LRDLEGARILIVMLLFVDSESGNMNADELNRRVDVEETMEMKMMMGIALINGK
jgi:hypothetical protein